jgi:chromosome segregation protein
MHRFKSFKHAELLFSKGFTCIVGPNGSGKSNICDALLFGLGEGSLRRLRARTLDSLITFSGSKSSGLRQAYITMELDGEEAVSITRKVRSDGKSMYKVNGKHMSRGDVQDLVNRHGIHADETNTITQGEINKFNDLNPKGRRELIDIASGIEEFERKKEEALKELEKVGQRISEGQIMLEERMGFLKELEAEKAIAEKYLQMSSRLKTLNYSIIITKKQDAEAMLSEYTRAMAISDAGKNELSNRLDAMAKKIEQLNLDRQQLTKDLGESAKAMGEINSRLEATKMEIAKLEMSNANRLASITESERTIKEVEAEALETKGTVSRNLAEIDALTGKIKEMEEKLGKSNIKSEDVPVDFGNVDELNALVAKGEAAVEELNNKILGFKGETSNVSSGKESLLKEIKQIESLVAELGAKKSEILKKQKEASSKFSSLAATAKALDSETDSLGKRISNSDENIIELRSQRGAAQPRGGAVYDKIKDKFGKEKGFHGKVSELCSYENKHAVAVEASAGGRFDYIVVDSIGTADAIIKYLRDNGLGRATFIPMKELQPSSEPAREKEAKPIIDVIEFDPKFKSAMGFVFSNTYLVDDSDQAKKLGIGKHRYVTTDGNVIEQSGVMAGGSVQKRISLTNIDRQIKELTESSVAMKKELAEKTEQVFKQRRETAYAEAEMKSAEKELIAIENEIKRHDEGKAGASREIKKIEEQEAKLAKELAEEEKQHQKMQEVLEASRERLSKAYNKTIEISKHLAKFGMSKEDLDKLEAMRKEAEALRIRKAEMQKENQMLEDKANGLKKQAGEQLRSITEAKKLEKESEKKLKELEMQKKETEGKITSDNDISKKIYGKINGLDQEIGKMTFENTRLGTEHASLDRQLSELKMKRSQAETRIADFTAELAVYKEEMVPVKEVMAEMEKEAIVLNAKISELGNVNLKAPEMFDDKKRNADEAVAKVKTLENERHAVLTLIEEIDSKKLQTFMSTLNEIAKNFSKLYNYIFPGSASIMLETPKDPFNSGIEIKMTSDKGTKILSASSGGEKSLISLILIFAIHMCKPSALYIFDEVDAALDKENSKKLSQLIKEMSKNAQFVVVSHNDSLIVNADTAIGVAKTNEESRAVGIEISSILNKK